MASSVTIGRVAVKVLPDTGDFRRDLKRKLDQIEHRLKLEIPTTVNMAGAKRDLLTGVRELNAEIRTRDTYKVKLGTTLDTTTTRMREDLNRAVRKYEELSRTNRVKLQTELGPVSEVNLDLNDENLRKTKEKIDHWVRQNSPIKIPVQLELSEVARVVTGARIGILTRDRTVNIIPRVSKAAALKAGAALAALSGARVLKSVFTDFTDIFRNIDKLVPLIGTIGLAVLGLAGFALTAAANLAALSASLASIAPAALGVPGILGGMAVGLTVTLVAFKDINKIVPEVKQAWGTLKKTISDNFWTKAAKPIRKMTDNLLPVFVSGFKQASTAIGGYFGSLASKLERSFLPTVRGMFKDLAKSTKIATTGTGALASIITVLGQTGASYLPRLAKWFVDISKRFSAFITKAKNSGELQGWIDGALVALHELGNSLRNIGRILGGLGRAALNAGGSSLTIFSATLQHLADVINSPAFQRDLTMAFRGAFQMMHNIATTAGPAVSNLFHQLAQTFRTLLPLVGKTIGTIGKAIANLLANPALQRGLQAFFRGFDKGIRALAPAFERLAPYIGNLLGVIGDFASKLGPLLGAALDFITPIFDALVTAAKPFIDALMPALTSLIRGLAPAAKDLATAFIGLAKPIAKALGPALDQIVPALVKVATLIVKDLTPILPVLGQAFAKVLTALAPLVVAMLDLLLKALKPLLPILVKFVKDSLPKLADVFVRLVNTCLPFIAAMSELVDVLMPILVPVVKAAAIAMMGLLAAMSLLVAPMAALATLVSKAFTAIKTVISNAMPLIRDLAKTGWTAVKSVTSTAWSAISGVVTNTLGTIKSGVSSAFSFLTGRGTGESKALKVGVSNNYKAMGANVMSAADRARVNTSRAWESLSAKVQQQSQFATRNATSAVNQIPGVMRAAWMRANEVTSNGSAKVVRSSDDAISRIPGNMRSAFLRANQATTQGTDQITTTVGGLKGSLSEKLAGAGNMLYSAGASIMDGLVQGIRDHEGALWAELSSITASIPKHKGPPSTDRTLLVHAGQLIMDGLVKGLKSKQAALRKLLREITHSVVDWSKVKKADAHELENAASSIPIAIGRGLSSRTDSVQQAINTISNVLKKMPKGAFANALGKGNNKLRSDLSSYNALGRSLDVATQKYNELSQAAESYYNSIRDNIMASGNPTQLDDQSFKSIVKNMTSARDKARKFASALADLKKKGLKQTTIDQLAQAGPEQGLAAAQSILAAGKKGIAQVNQLQDSINAAARRAAATARDAMFKDGLYAAQGVVQGLKDQRAAIEKEMKHISDAMVRAIRKALGIHSPSRVFRTLMGHVGDGMLLGLESKYSKVQRSMQGFANKLAATDFGSPTVGLEAQLKGSAANAALASTASPQPGTTRIFNYHAAPGGVLGKEDVFKASQSSRFAW